MIGNNVYGGGSGNTKKLIGNFPFTSNITDTLGNLILTYTSGGTNLTCNESGFYAYKGELTFTDFSSLITGDYLEFEMQIRYENTGTSEYPYYRRILWNNKLSFEINPSQTNKISINVLGGSVLRISENTYNGTNYHKLIIKYNYTDKTIYFQIDNQEGYLVSYSNLSKTDILIINKINYGLNGYIKDLKVYTG